MHNLRYFIFLIVVSCGGGSSSVIDNENTFDNSGFGYVYIPPTGKSNENCVSKSNNVTWLEDFENTELDSSKWSYDEGCNNNGGGCNGNNEYQNYTANDKENLFI